MEKYLSLAQQKVLLQNAPANLDKSKIIKSWVDQGVKLEGFNIDPSKSEEKPLFDLSGNGNTRVGDKIKEVGSKIADTMSDTTKSPLQKGFSTTAEAFGAIPVIANEALPASARKVTDKIANVTKKGFDAVTNKIADVPVVRDAALSGQTNALEQGLGVASDAGIIAGAIDGTVGGAKGIQKIAQKTPAALKSIANAAEKMTVRSEDQIQASILENYAKGVKPTIAGKTSLVKDAAYKAHVIDAVKTIKENAPNLTFTDDVGEAISGQTPKTLQQLAESVDQTKKSIFTKYDSLAKEAGDSGVEVDMAPISNELDQVIGNKALSITNPGAIKYAEGLKERLSAVGKLDAKTAQDVIQNYNKSLEAFYKNPSYETASQAAIDALIANKIRGSLDEGITGLTGKQYGILKKQYGALKNIENDVVKAALRDARKNTKGLIDYTDIFSGGQVVNGLLSLNPGQIASGVTQKAISALYKHLNNPNRAIQAMFSKAEALSK